MQPFEARHRDIIDEIISRQDSVKAVQGEIKEALKMLADELETKPATINQIIRLVRKERQEAGSLAMQQEILSIAEEAANS